MVDLLERSSLSLYLSHGGDMAVDRLCIIDILNGTPNAWILLRGWPADCQNLVIVTCNLISRPINSAGDGTEELKSRAGPSPVVYGGSVGES